MIFKENRAAQYVRMSTDMQRYSIENQSEAIALYAARRGLTIVRTYEDAGRSGLRMAGREALQTLMHDVRSGIADYETILVYDVSRWGRFQDADESAYYEFLCKEAGVKIEYCAEQFDNDGSLAATILKNIKRAMAGEFSRELSVKVYAGLCKSASNGFFVGSTPGYGLRRFLVDENGNKKMEMSNGERKCTSSLRTILVPGPANETRVVRQIYSLFIDDRYSLCRIARQLNDEAIPNAANRQWNSVAVRQVLSNAKYSGTAVYNRTSRKLNGPMRRNPTSQWIMVENAFEPVISVERFEKAQQQLRSNARAYTHNELLDSLTALWCRKGILNASVIDRCSRTPSVNTYLEHFGGLVPAYRKIGYVGRFSRGRSPQFRKSVVNEIAEQIGRLGGTVNHDRQYSQILVNDEIEIGIVAGCVSPRCRKNQWQIRRKDRAKPDILVVIRVDDNLSEIRDFIFVPLLLLTNEAWLSISIARLKRLSAFRSRTLDPLFQLCARQPLAIAQ